RLLVGHDSRYFSSGTLNVSSHSPGGTPDAASEPSSATVPFFTDPSGSFSSNLNPPRAPPPSGDWKEARTKRLLLVSSSLSICTDLLSLPPPPVFLISDPWNFNLEPSTVMLSLKNLMLPD